MTCLFRTQSVQKGRGASMKREMILPVLLSFGISLALGPVLIPFLRKVKAGQKEREEGVPSHQKKAGTPTMGGVMFLAAFTAVSLLFRKEGAEVVPVLFLTLGFGLIGFLDDYLKVVLHRSDGLYPKQKMALQAVITAVFLWYLARFSGISLRMRIPFLPGKELDAGIFTIPFLAFVILGTVNGVNFTDGLDGLAASVTILNAVFWEEIMDAMLELFACIENDEKKQTSAELLVQKALSIIKECYSDGINLEGTARRLHVTEQYLGTQLKKETGSSFTEIIRRYRIAHVKQLLLDTELKLNQIASMAGFSDPKYMSKVFKQEVGMLPNEYRRMNT